MFALMSGMSGSFISLIMSKWIAKMSTDAQVIEEPSNSAEQWLVNTVRLQAKEVMSHPPLKDRIAALQKNRYYL